MWGGRFERAPDASFWEFQRSFPFDRRLLPYELAVDRAWARALGGLGILTDEELRAILGALDKIETRAAAEPVWVASSNAEDVHHFAEMHVMELAGAAGGKLHTGRSRNELIVTEFRMWIKDAAATQRSALAALIRALLDHAEKNSSVPMPGNTHLQHAQPILWAHYLLAHVEAFFHDADRLAFAANTANACPMGAGALAGCTLTIDRMALARELGFERITRNSLDSVSRRDFALDFLYALAVTAQHLSRLAEDMTLFAAPEFGFIALPDEYATGSSLMPQKKNPDAWELTRGKCGRVISALHTLLVTLKGLPTGYQRDLQEDKEPAFGAHDHVLAMLQTAAGAIGATGLREERLREATADAGMVATEAADYLVARGVPFRKAHEIVGQMVREAERRGQPWTTLPLDALRQFSPEFGPDLHAALTVESALASKRAAGGTAPDVVRAALSEARGRLAQLEERA
jgi:argininosuccinate lyase